MIVFVACVVVLGVFISLYLWHRDNPPPPDPPPAAEDPEWDDMLDRAI